ncbi:MAG: hypothetical protein R2759_11200 [Bacteroidales bacterium]
MRFNTGNNYKLFIETGPAFEIVPLKWGIGTETVSAESRANRNKISVIHRYY